MTHLTHKSANLTLNPQGQSDKAVQDVVAHILRLAGCPACGRVMKLGFEFVGDPVKDLGAHAVIDAQLVGF